MSGRPLGVRAQAAQATRDRILRAATKVFARHGFAGGRVEQISKAAKSHDRMIYYYFGSKEGLFIAVLEEMYQRFNEAESKLVLDTERPVEALKAVIRFMWDHPKLPLVRRSISDTTVHWFRTRAHRIVFRRNRIVLNGGTAHALRTAWPPRARKSGAMH
jgi:AcrR family transcriptional regulator